MSPLPFLLVFVGLVEASRTEELKINVGRRTRESKKSVPKLYQHEGCFNAGITAGSSLGDFSSSHSAVEKCAQMAFKQGFAEFSLENGGHCRGGDNLQQTYLNTGTSISCSNGVGEKGAAAVYSIIQTPSRCRIESSDKATKSCRRQRQRQTMETRLDYELGLPSRAYPLPSLNRSQSEVSIILQKDALDNHWITLYNTTIWKNVLLFLAFDNRTKYTELETEGDFTRTYNFFVQRRFFGVPDDDRKYFRFQFQDANNPFRNLSELALWREDGVFTDQRLAGSNPMAIQRVSWNPELSGGVDWTELSERLNPNFDWEGAIQDVLGMDISLNQAIWEGYIYAVHYPLYNGLTTVSPDLFGTVMDAFSPIAIFASKPSRRQLPNRLRPVAIQLNSSTAARHHPNLPIFVLDSAVFTPADTELWLKAKHVLQVADYAQAQVVEHLFKLHLYMEPICVCVHRHLSKLHPLHHMLKHHCRGLIGTNKLGYPFLAHPEKGSFNKLLAVGYKGAMKMMFRAYRQVSWNDLDFLKNIKNRGLDDKRKLPYFPYRDDGQLIHETISNMVNEYVNQYYKSHKEVRQDRELQNFAHDASLGSGKVKNFPSQITSKWILKKHVTRIIWVLSAQHSIINYPADHITALTPNMPTKLYNDDRVGVDHYGVYNLPRRFTCADGHVIGSNQGLSFDDKGGKGRDPGFEVACGAVPEFVTQASLSMTLASLHYDSLFDYADRLQDKKGRLVVQKYYKYLHGYVKTTIEQRNAQRFEKGYLPYPYLLPRWIANSIHT